MAKWWKPAVKWRFRFVIIMLLQVFLLCYMVEYLNREGDAEGLQERYWGLFHGTNVVRGGPSDFESSIVEEDAEVGSGGKGVKDLDREDEGEDEEKRRVVRELDSAVKEEEKEKGREGERGLEPSDLGGKAEAMETPKDTEKEAEREQNEERERQQKEDRERQRAKEKMEEEGVRQAAEEVKRAKEEEDEDRAAEAAGFPDWPVGPGGGEAGLEGREACEAWLGDQDEVRHERTFDRNTDPVIVKADYTQSWPECAAGCRFEVVTLEHDAQMGDTSRNCKFPMRRPRSSTTRRAASMAVTALPAPTAIIEKKQPSRSMESRAATALRTTQDQIRRSRLRVRRSASQEEKNRAVEFVRWAEKGGVDLFDRRRRSLQAVTPEDIGSFWGRGAARGDSQPLDRRRGAGEGWKGGSERGRRVLMEGGVAEDRTGGAARTLYVDGGGQGFATGQEEKGIGGGVGVGLRGAGASAQIVRRCPLTATLTMEPVSYYPQFSLKEAHKNGFDVLMTSNLNSEVPAQYFSWAEYVIMDPLTNKTREALAAAFISNCGANSFREEALEGLMKEGVKVDSWGRCQHNVPDSAPAGSKETLLKDYRFCLAFENSEEDDYVTEKFFQCLVAGSVPVVVGAPTIHDFEPEKDTIFHLQSIKDVPKIARKIIEVNNNLTLWNHMLRWKQQGPSDDFKALMDLSIVHSSCRLCIYTATKIWEQEEIEMGYPRRRPCRCRFRQAGGGATSHLYHLFVRERGRLNFEQVYLPSANVTLEGLRGHIRAVFEARGHRPVWEETPDRPQVLRPPPGAPLKIHRVYPAHATVRASLFGSAWFRNTAQFLRYLRYNPCPKLEVIFV